MSPKDNYEFGLLLLLVAIYLEAHPFWLILFSMVILYGILQEGKERKHLVTCQEEPIWQSLSFH